MNALILNGERNNESMLYAAEGIVRKELLSAGWQADIIALREKEIAPCMGCFGCWLKTPGVCVLDDFGREIASLAVGSDVMIFLTSITFGGYSSELKKAIDRFACPMLLPLFTKIKGEIHHKARYNPLPDLIAIGVLPERDDGSERVFKGLVERNAVNLHCRISQSAVFYESQGPESIAKEMRFLLEKIGREK
jgi:NADPH-dependent FMN reductase